MSDETVVSEVPAESKAPEEPVTDPSTAPAEPDSTAVAADAPEPSTEEKKDEPEAEAAAEPEQVDEPAPEETKDEPAEAPEPAEAETNGDAPKPEDTEDAKANGETTQTNGADKIEEEEKKEDDEEDEKPAKKKASATPARTKKTNGRKSTAPAEPEVPFTPGAVVLAKVKGYPAWPGIIVTEDLLAEDVLAAKPKAGARRRKSATLPAEALDNNVYPVMFFVDRSYMWAARPELKELTPKEARAHVNKSKKSSSLTEAYSVAINPPDLKTVAREIKEAIAAAAAEEELEDEEEEEEPEEKPKSRKRKATPAKDTPQKKRAATTAAPKKTPGRASRGAKKDGADIFDPDSDAVDPEDSPPSKRGAARRSNAGDAAASETGSKRKGASDGAAGGSARKRTRSENNSSGSSAPSEGMLPDIPLTQEERAKHLRSMRHRIQRNFIHNDPTPQDVAQLSVYLQRLESLHNLEVSLIKGSKIKKVLSVLSKQEIPGSHKYNIQERIGNLINTWNDHYAQSEKTPADPATSTEEKTNGTKEAEADNAATEKDKAESPNP